jgi:predicted Zn-dependent protease
MKSTCIMTSLVCVAMLSACATTSPPAPTTLATSTTNIRAAMAEANAAALSGRPDKAYVLLKQATATYPVDKAPWVRMAQMRFDSNNYGEAIVNALEALRRDPDDTLANSVVAVSGLRLSSKALADLTRKNNLSGTVRSEAQDLAKLLRNSLNEDVLVGSSSSRVTRKEPPRAKTPQPVSTTTASASGTSGTQSKPATSASPFGALK